MAARFKVRSTGLSVTFSFTSEKVRYEWQVQEWTFWRGGKKKPNLSFLHWSKMEIVCSFWACYQIRLCLESQRNRKWIFYKSPLYQWSLLVYFLLGKYVHSPIRRDTDSQNEVVSWKTSLFFPSFLSSTCAPPPQHTHNKYRVLSSRVFLSRA